MKKLRPFLLSLLLFCFLFSGCTQTSQTPESISSKTFEMLNAPFTSEVSYQIGSLEGTGTLTKSEEALTFEVLSPDTLSGVSLTITAQGASASLYGISFPVPEQQTVSGAVEAMQQFFQMQEEESWTVQEEGETTVYQNESFSIAVLADDSFSEIRFPSLGLTFFFTSFTRSSLE